MKGYVLLILLKREQKFVQIVFPNEFAAATFPFGRLVVQPVVIVQKGRDAV